MPYKDLRQAIAALEKAGVLRHVTAEVDKDWEISAVMRWVYMGYAEENRYAIMFDRIKGFPNPLVVGALGASYKTYAVGLEIDPSGPQEKVVGEIRKRWAQALDNPIEPRIVAAGPCKENIVKGKDVNLQKFPVPVWTPEKDANWELGLGFLTSAYHITKDPDTGRRNVGTYRNMLRQKPGEMGIMTVPSAHISCHIRKNEALGRATEIATVIGCDPTVGMTSVTRVPEGMDELAVSGGLRGEPVELVKCETVDLEVPATAEMVIEGRLPPRSERPYEKEGPFGEGIGHQGGPSAGPVYEVSCITYRHGAIMQGFISQMPPSECTKIVEMSTEALLLRQLRAIGIEGIVDIHVPETTAMGVIIVSIRKSDRSHPSRIAAGISSIYNRLSKFIIVTDDDIDIRDYGMVFWAMTMRTSMAPTRRGIHFLEGFSATPLDYSAAPSFREHEETREPGFSWPQDLVLIDGTRPYVPYPTLSLPPKRYLEAARDGWAKYGLPPLEKKTLLKSILLEEEYLKKGTVVNP